MKNKCYSVLISILFFLCSCSKDIQTDINCKKIIFKNNTFALCDSIDFRFIPLETTDESMIGSVSDVKIVDNKIFISDIYKSNAIFVFDINGKFITKIGTIGNAPHQYVNLFGFDIDKEKQLVALDDRHKKRLLFYDLDSFKYKSTLNIDFNFADFHLLKDGNIAFFNYEGFNSKSKKDKSYLLISDSTGKEINTFYDCVFPASETLSNTKKRIYTFQNKSFVFHHLFPYIYNIGNKRITPMYELIFDTFKFPTIEFLKDNSANNYTRQLSKSDLISSYGIYETKDLICCPFVCKRQYHIGLYNKLSDNGYLFTVPDFYRESRLGVFTNLKGCTDDYIISVIQPEDIRKVKNNSILYSLSGKITEEDNPVICLFKLK